MGSNSFTHFEPVLYSHWVLFVEDYCINVQKVEEKLDDLTYVMCTCQKTFPLR